MNLRMMGMGALGGFALAAFAVWPLARADGMRAGASAAKAREAAASRVILRTLTERDQCRAQVDKVNAAMAAQVEELARVVSEDRVEREAAAKRMEAAAARAASESKRAGERAAAAREVIQNAADQCARAGVPPDVLRVLNDILGVDSGGGVSASQNNN